MGKRGAGKMRGELWESFVMSASIPRRSPPIRRDPRPVSCSGGLPPGAVKAWYLSRALSCQI